MRLVLRRYAPVKRLQRLAFVLASVLLALATIYWGGTYSGIEPLAASGKSSERGGSGPGEEAGEDGHADAGRRVPVGPVVVVFPIVIPVVVVPHVRVVVIPVLAPRTSDLRTAVEAARRRLLATSMNRAHIYVNGRVTGGIIASSMMDSGIQVTHGCGKATTAGSLSGDSKITGSGCEWGGW